MAAAVPRGDCAGKGAVCKKRSTIPPGKGIYSERKIGGRNGDGEGEVPKDGSGSSKREGKIAGEEFFNRVSAMF